MSLARLADPRGLAPLVVLLPLLLLAPTLLADFELQRISKFLIFAILAMSLDLLAGRAGLVSLGHAAFFALGAYAFTLLGGACPTGASLPILLALAASALAAGALAAASGLFALRTGGIYFLMVTLAVGQMTFYALHDIPLFGGSDGIFICRSLPSLASFTPTQTHYALSVFGFAFVVLLLWQIRRSFFGKLLAAVHASEPRLGALGFPTFPLKLAAFALAGAIAGFAGGLEALRFGFVNPEMASWHVSGVILVMVVLGGRNTLWGPVLGAAIVVGLEDFLVFRFSDHWRIGIGVLAVAVALWLPDGVAAVFAQGGRARTLLHKLFPTTKPATKRTTKREHSP